MSSPKSSAKSAGASRARASIMSSKLTTSDWEGPAAATAEHAAPDSKLSSSMSDMGSSAPSSTGVADKAASFAEDAAQSVSSLASDVSEATKSATAAAKQQAGNLKSHIASELANTAEAQKQHGADAIRGFAHAIDAAARDLESQSPLVARYIHDAAAQIDTLGGSLGKRSIDDLVRSVSDMARNRPALFIGGAVAVGMVLARFLKSSTPSQYETADRSYSGNGDYAGREASADSEAYASDQASYGRRSANLHS